MTRGLVLSAPASGSGKTVLTLGLLQALRNRGHRVVSAKSGPDFIDPRFHEAATGHPCVNLDRWAMSTSRLRALASGQPGDLLIVEGAMGLFDGAPPLGHGSTADLAASLDLPVVLIVDVGRMGQSIAPLVHGFLDWRTEPRIGGIILNRIGSQRHLTILERALAPLMIPVLGAVPRHADLELPSRHLGLVQALEHADLTDRLSEVAAVLERHVDIDAMLGITEQLQADEAPGLTPPGGRIAVASDEAFAFAYPHLLSDWRRAGAEISLFSPLADEAPRKDADFVFLPGGYPELHTGKLAAAIRFKRGLREHSGLIYGECGGYMVLGECLVDAAGEEHEMAGLLPLATSFAQRRRTLGYRRLGSRADLPWSGELVAHEFHYATIQRSGQAEPLFDAWDAEDVALPPMGMRVGRAMGSFAHVIDHATPRQGGAEIRSNCR